MSRLIDADALRKEIHCAYSDDLEILDHIDAQQTVDAVEVVRCKDCKYNPNPPEFGNAACVLFYGMTDQMGFCHHGERRERE